MAKYHISKDGVVRACSAAEGNCPLGVEAEHFSTKIAARSAYEARQEAATIAPSLQKKKSLQEKRDELDNSTPIVYETVEPSREFSYVSRDVDAGKLSVQDIFFSNGKKYTIGAIKRGTKNATIRAISDGKEKTFVFGLTETVPADISEETPASKASRNIYYRESSLERRLVNYEPKRAKALANMAVAIQKGYSIDSFRIKELVAAEADDQVMSLYEHNVERVKTAVTEGREGYENEASPYTRAFEDLKEEFTQDVIRQAARGESNSTSGLSNMFDMELLAAKANFIDRPYFG